MFQIFSSNVEIWSKEWLNGSGSLKRWLKTLKLEIVGKSFKNVWPLTYKIR